MKERIFPIDYPHPLKERFIFRLTIPDGYQVESIPDSASFNLEDGTLGFTMRSSVDENTMTINRSFKVGQQQYLCEYYPYIKEIYDRMIEKMNEPIVLKKKS